MFTRSARSARLLPALAILVVTIGACGAAGAKGGLSGAGPVSSQGGAAAAPSSTLPSATSMPPPEAAVSPSSGPASTPAPGAATSPPPTLVTGQVKQIYSTGDFILDDGHVTYTVVMSPTTAVINLRNRQVPRQYIQVAESVQVTGTVSGSNIEAQTVLVPTTKDDQ